MRINWLDRIIGWVDPAEALKRTRARAATEVVKRHYEAAQSTRRTQGWRRGAGDANAVAGPALAKLRTAARDLVRNNGHATKAVRAIANHVVGWGIVAKPVPPNAKAAAAWKAWAESTACDSDGRHDFYGLQKLIVRTVVESGECLVRRRLRFPEDGLPIPLQLQVLEPDYIDTDKNQVFRDSGGRVRVRIVHGIEYDMLGRRTAYWLFPEHPGSEVFSAGTSMRVPAESVLHVYRVDRPGQVRGPSWFAPVLLKFKDFDEFSDATLMKQKIAACLAVITTDHDGTGAPLGTESTDGTVDSLEPGMILNTTPGKDVHVINPPTVREYPEYAHVTLHEIAAGVGISYEDLTGDFSKVNFSSARMARLSYWEDVYDWRWRMLIPQFCNPAWAWAMQAAGIMGLASEQTAVAWTAPPMPMIEPDKEGLAHQRNIRSGLTTLYEVLRERGHDPAEVLDEYEQVNKDLDAKGIILDSDPRKTTQAGQPVAAMLPQPAAGAPDAGDGPDPENDEAGKLATEDEDEAEAERQRAAMATTAAAVSDSMIRAFDSGARAGTQAVIQARKRTRPTRAFDPSNTPNPGGPSAPSKE